jgi:Fungal specific transcription factor domain
MSGLIQELAAYQNAFQPKDKTRHVIPQHRDEIMVEMMKALPSSFLFGTLQARYIQNWETIWRVLHIGTFMKKCDQASAVIESGILTRPPQMHDWDIPQILATISTGSRLNDQNERGSTTERISDDQITKNLGMVKAWLGNLHGKAHANFPTLQTRALLLLAQQVNLSTPSELWLESGILVRNAMLMGLHQDPEPWEFSKFDKEARRKLWLTIVELDLQFSLAAGMPSAVSPNMCNTRELLNVDDQDLTPEMNEYPPSKPLSTYTDALPQLALSASLSLRLQVTNLLGSNVDLATSAPHLLCLAADLEKHLQSLPPPFRSSTRSGASSNKRLHRLFTSIQLELSIRGPLLALYRSISMSEFGERFPEARKGAVRNALAVLGNLDALDPAVADLSVVKGKEYLNLFHILHRTSILQSALILCYEIKLYNSRSSTMSSAESYESAQERELDREGVTDVDWAQSRVSLTRVVENTVKSLLDRIGGFGCDLKDILPLCVALGAVRCDGDNEERKQLMRRGAERVRDACRVVRPDVLIKFRTQLNEGKSSGWGLCGRAESEPKVVGNEGNEIANGNGDPNPPEFEMGFGGVDMVCSTLL